MKSQLKIEHFDKIGSTNDYALELISNADLKSDMAIIADKQMNGRGRLNGRLWESPAGNFYCSYIINLQNLKIDSRRTNSLTFAIMKSLQNFLIDFTKANAFSLKLPNDILICNKKLAGVLTEISYPYAVVGIGINLTNSPIERATNLKEELNFLVKPMELVENLYEFLIKGIMECYFH